MDIGQLWILLGCNTAGLNQAQVAVAQFAATSTASMDRVAAALDRTSIRFQRFGSMSTMYLSLPLVAAGTAAVKLASDLEFATQKTVALAGISQSQMNAWQSDIIRIGNSTNRASKEIADALYYTASAGIKTKEAMDIVEMSARGAASGLGDTDVIARFLTYSMNAYGKEAFASSRVMDILTIAVREGTAEASTMVGVLGNILPVASALGVPIDQVAASLAAMTRTGFDASKSATALRQIMVSLLHPSVEARKALEMMSKSTGDSSVSIEGLRRTLRDEGLIETLEKIDKLTNIFGEEMAGIIFPNVRALTGDLSLVGAKLEENKKIFTATKNETGVFANAFSIMTNTMSFNLGTVKKAAEQAFIGLGQSMMQPLIGILKDLVSNIRDLTNWYTHLSASTQSLILTAAKWLVLMGPISLGIGLLIRMYGIFRMAVLAVIPAINMLGNLMLAMPIIQYAVAAGLLATVIISLVNRTQELTAAQQVLNDVNATAEQSIVAERTKLEQLVRITQSEYASKKQKAEAIKTLNAMSPEYLGGINEESIRTKDANTAIQAYITSLKEKASLQAATTGLIEEEKRYILELANGQDREIGFLNELKDGMLDWLLLQKAGTEAEKEANEKAAKSSQIHKERIKAYQNQIDAITNLIAAKEKEVALDGTMVTRNVEAYKYRDVLQEINDKIRASLGLKNTVNSYIDPNIESDAAAKAAQAARDARNLQEEEAARRKKQMEDNAKIQEEIAKIWQRYGEGLREVQNKTSLFGETIDSTGKKFNSADAYASLYNTTLDSLLKYVNASDPSLKKLIANLDQFRGVTGFTKAVMIDLTEQLRVVDNQYTQSGNKIEWISEKISILTQTAKTLSSQGINTTDLRTQITALTSELSNANLTKALADAAIQSSLLGGKFDELGAKTVAHQAAVAELVKQYTAAKQIGDIWSMLVIQIKLNQEKTTLQTLSLANSVKTYEDALNEANNAQLLMGKSYDGISPKLQANENALKALIAQYTDIKRVGGDLTAWQTEWNLTLADNYELQKAKALREYNVALQENTDKQLTAGKSYNKANEDLNAYIILLEQYRRITIQAGQDTTALDAALKKLGQVHINAQELSAFRKEMKEIVRIAETANQVFTNFVGGYTSMISAQENQALDLVQKTADSRHKSQAWVEKQNEKIREEYAKKKKIASLAEAAVNIALGVTQAIAQLGWYAAIAIPFILATGAMQIAAIQASPMADGGVVPNGYANDTYPALLTSGETVVPPGKLGDLTNNQSKNQKVRFEIEGHILVGFLEEMNVLNNSF